MRELVALTLILLSSRAAAEEWIPVRKPSDPEQAGTPAVLVDLTSIEILESGIRRARGKFDWTAVGPKFDSSNPRSVVEMIWVK